jgi:hypothetical protein
MQINELTDLGCEACGDSVDPTADSFEPVLPLLCGRCRAQLVEEEADRMLPVAA